VSECVFVYVKEREKEGESDEVRNIKRLREKKTDRWNCHLLRNSERERERGRKIEGEEDK
jgi:hypothetical protein